MANFCDGNGLKCCQGVTVDKRKCLKSCFGVYADVSRVKDEYEKTFKNWEIVGQKYKNFKNMYGDNITYPPELLGMYINLIYYVW